MSVSIRWLQCVTLACALIVTGCATDSTKPVAAPEAKQKVKTVDSRTKEMRKWVGSKAEKLMAEMGSPAQTIDATLLGRPPAEAFIYPAKDGSGCMDAFVVQEGTNEITDYFCR